MSKDNLLTRIRSGDDTVLKEVYLHYREPFFAYIQNSFSLDPEHIKELFQLSIVIFYDNVVTGKLETLNSGLKTYLFAIGKNKAQELLREKRKISQHLDEVLIETILDEDEVEDKKQLETDILLITQALESLGEPCKKILQLFYYQQLSMSQISEALAYKNAKTTKNLKYKCIKRLQKIYQQVLV